MGPCRILTTYEPWPPWFQCDNTTRFPPRCKVIIINMGLWLTRVKIFYLYKWISDLFKYFWRNCYNYYFFFQNDVRELKFNTTGRCLEPLVQTDVSSYYYPGIDGCGIQCDNPMFPPTQRDQIHKMVGWVASICSLLNLFAVVSNVNLFTIKDNIIFALFVILNKWIIYYYFSLLLLLIGAIRINTLLSLYSTSIYAFSSSAWDGSFSFFQEVGRMLYAGKMVP